MDIESARRSFFVGDRGRRYLTGGGRAATSNAERPTPNIEHRRAMAAPIWCRTQFLIGTTEHTKHTETEPCLSVCSVCSVVPIRNCVLHQIGAARISTEANVYGALLKICMLNCSF